MYDIWNIFEVLFHLTVWILLAKLASFKLWQNATTPNDCTKFFIWFDGTFDGTGHSTVVAIVQGFSGLLSSFNDTLEDKHINCLVQSCNNSIANTLELLQSWTYPSICESTWLFNLNHEPTAKCGLWCGRCALKEFDMEFIFCVFLMADYPSIYPCPPMLLHLCWGKLMTDPVKKNWTWGHWYYSIFIKTKQSKLQPSLHSTQLFSRYTFYA